MDDELSDLSSCALGQHNTPSRQQLVQQFAGIFDRQYYTESGPLVRQLEGFLESRLRVSNVICVSNPTVAWIMLLEGGLDCRRLIAPATMGSAFIEGSRWTNCQLIPCDVDEDSNYRMAPAKVAELLAAGTADGIVGVNPWGGAAEIEGLLGQARSNRVKLFLDSSQALGSSVDKGPIGGLGDAEVFALTSANILNGADSACICTNDDLLADRLRCMRSSGGVRRHVSVSKTVNGRMSEAQAAYALISLEAIDHNITRNMLLHETYAKHLHGIVGVTLRSAIGVSTSNYQQAVITVDEQRYGSSARDLVKLLHGESIPARLLNFPLSTLLQEAVAIRLTGFRTLAETGVELPLGTRTSKKAVEAICRTLAGLGRQRPWEREPM